MAECECEDSSQSEHPSPGPVENDEVVLRLVFLPQQINEDGTIKPTSLEKTELKRQVAGQAPDRGFSVHRQSFVDEHLMTSRAKAFQERKPDERKEVHAFAANVSEIRALLHDGVRALCVVDRAEPDDQSHAECWGALPGRSEATLKKIRVELVALFKPSSKVA